MSAHFTSSVLFLAGMLMSHSVTPLKANFMHVTGHEGELKL